MMAELAAHRMTDDDLHELGDSIEQMAERLGDHDQSTFLKMNKSFHDIIARGSGNAMFGVLVDALLNMLEGSALGINYPMPWRRAVIDAHTRIYDALVAKDGATSAAAMRDHIGEYVSYAERHFPEVLDAPITWSS